MPPTASLDAGAPSAASSAAAAPQVVQQRASSTFIAAYGLAYTAMFATLLAPVIISLALRVQQLVGPEAAPGTQSLVLGVAGLLALIGNPLFGRLSDRTVSRFGMRKPWLVIGVLGGFASLLVVATAPNVGVLLLGWCLAQLFYNALLAAMTALLPDQVPFSQRGLVSGVVGVGLPLGTVLGLFVVQLAAPNLLLMFLVPAAVAVVAVLLLVLSFTDRRLDGADRQTFRPADFLRSFWVDPRQHPDYAWAWWSRFLLFMGLATLLTYQAFYLINVLQVPPAEVAQRVFIATLVQSVVVLVASAASGYLSDRLGRRKVLVFTAAVIYALGLVVIAFASNFTTFLVGMAVTGLGQGVYLAVDRALVTDVLPNKDTDAAKDLGVFNIANAAPQSIAPAIAPLFLAIGGPNNFVSLFLAAGVFVAIGALAIVPLRRVR